MKLDLPTFGNPQTIRVRVSGLMLGKRDRCWRVSSRYFRLLAFLLIIVHILKKIALTDTYSYLPKAVRLSVLHWNSEAPNLIILTRSRPILKVNFTYQFLTHQWEFWLYLARPRPICNGLLSKEHLSNRHKMDVCSIKTIATLEKLPPA